MINFTQETKSKFSTKLLNEVKSLLEITSSHRLIILFLISLTIYGSYIRSYNTLFGPDILNISGDDFYHIFVWSGVKGLWDSFIEINQNLFHIFVNSYKDAHPPLRNVLLNLLMRFIDSIYSTRLIGFLPGILLIPMSAVFAYQIFNNSSRLTKLYLGLFLATLFTFMEDMVLLSFETRPYMFMMLFNMATIMATIKFHRSKSKTWLMLFWISSLLAIFTAYTNYVIISICSLSIAWLYIKNNLDNHTKNAIPRFLIIILSISLIQIITLVNLKVIHNFTGENISFVDYIYKNYITNLKSIPHHIYQFFEIFSHSVVSYSSPSQLLQNIFFISFILGVLILAKRKSYFLLIVTTLPLIIAILLSVAKIYPFAANRHCLYLIPSILIAVITFFELILNLTKNDFMKHFIGITMCLFCTFNTNIFYTNPYINRFSKGGIYGFNKLKPEELNHILNFLDSETIKNEYVVFDEAVAEAIKQSILIRGFNQKLKDRKKTILSNPYLKNSNYCFFNNRHSSFKACDDLFNNNSIKTNSLLVVAFTKDDKEDFIIDKALLDKLEAAEYIKASKKHRIKSLIIFEYLK